MRIYRGPLSGDNRDMTDSKEPADFIEDWKTGKTISFDGTIDKSGTKHFGIGIKIEEEDILALSKALIDKYHDEQDRLKEKVKDLEQDVQTLKQAFAKTYHLIHSNKAPSDDELLKAISSIAEHYGSKFTGQCTVNGNPEIKWIKWESLPNMVPINIAKMR